MKKIFLIFTFIIFFTTQTVFAASNYGEVKDITKQAGDSLTKGEGKLEKKGDTTTIRYGTSTFKMLEKDENAADGERPGPAAWIGFKITEPTEGSNSKFKVTTPDNKTTEISSSSYTDYVGITPTNLKNALLKGTALTYKYSFDWDENNENDQFVIIEIAPEEITLIDTSGETVWSPEIAKDLLEAQNPKTSDINLLLIISLIIISGLGITYYFKKA